MSFQRSPTVDGVLDFTNKLHKTVYDEGCKKLEGPSYDLCASGRHTFLTSLTFRSQKMKWSDDGTGILDYPTGATSASGTLITKNVLECDGELDLEALKIWVQSFVSSESRAAQDDDMLFNCIVNSLSSDGMVKVYSRYDDFTTAGYNSSILLMKLVFRRSRSKDKRQDYGRQGGTLKSTGIDDKAEAQCANFQHPSRNSGIVAQEKWSRSS